MLNELNINKDKIFGPVGSVKGIGGSITHDKGRVKLNLNIFGKVYNECFLVLEDPGIPGNVLLSAQAMGRCGLSINFRDRKVISADTNIEVTFGMEQSPVNLANLHMETIQDNVKSRTINKKNENPRLTNHFSKDASKITKQVPSSPMFGDTRKSPKLGPSSGLHLNGQGNRFLAVKGDNNELNSPKPVSNIQHSCRQNENEYTHLNETENTHNKVNTEYNKGNTENVHNKANTENKYNPVIKTESRNNKINEIEDKYNNLNQGQNFDGQRYTEIQQGKAIIQEVLYLGQVPKSKSGQVLDCGSENLEYTCFTNEEKHECFGFVSPDDDHTVLLQTVYDTILLPKTVTKVQLATKATEDHVSEIIISKSDHTPDGIAIDTNLTKINGRRCETFVCNMSRSSIRLIPGQIICTGTILDYPLVGLSEEAFAAISKVESDTLEKELNLVQFPEAKDKLIKLLRTFRNVVALDGDKLGRTNYSEHKIKLERDAKPFYIPNYKLPISRREVIETMIEDMKRDDIVKPSNSPYNSPLLLVPKKDGSWRMVIDYRQLNKSTVPDRFPMPVINEVLSQLGGAKIFSALDLLSGYWQVPLDEESKPLTAFSTHKEHLEFQVMPFGLTNAPLTFSRIMLQVLGTIPNVFVYLDDVIIFSKDKESHFKTLTEVLERLNEAGLKVKIKKCQFFMKELDYLGHRINEEGIKMQAGKVEAIVKYPEPQNLKALRRFLGMIGYYRPFIQDFSTKAHALTELLKEGNSFKWGLDEIGAFMTLKEHLLKDPILVYPDFNEEFFLVTDASSTGLGAVLMQKRKLRMRVISYASRKLNETEQRYSTTEREALALFWGLKKFKHLILGYKVNILTDHKPLLDLYKKREFIQNSKFNRWFMAILEFCPNISYIPGTSNTLADGLSRAFEDTEPKVVNKKFCFTCKVVDLDLDMVQEVQDCDEVIRCIKADLLGDEQSRPDFEILNGLVYKKARNDGDWSRLYVPSRLVKEVLFLIHSHKLAGHLGIAKTKELVRKNYYWPRCSLDVEEYIKSCDVCNRVKGVTNKPAPLEKYPAELYPFQVVTMDFLGPMRETPRGNKYLLVFLDHFTRWVEVIPCPNRLAATVADAFKSRIITRHSCPEVLLSDNAAEFTSEVLEKLCKFYGTKKIQVTPYKASSNGAVERANQKILGILRTMVTSMTEDWDRYIDDVQLVINNSVNVTTSESPHYLLYGYQKRLPVTLLDNVNPPRKTYNYDDFIAERCLNYFKTVKATRESIKRAQSEWENNSGNPEVRGLKIGNQVYVKNLTQDGPNPKLGAKFNGPYRVIKILSNNRFEVQDEQTLQKKIVHYNHIKSNKSLPWLQENDEDDPPANPINVNEGRYNLRSRK